MGFNSAFKGLNPILPCDRALSSEREVTATVVEWKNMSSVEHEKDSFYYWSDAM